jgi:hypothetical protein
MVKTAGRTVSPFFAAAIFTAAMAVPAAPGTDPLPELPVLLVLSAGILMSVVFTGFSTSGTPLSVFPFMLTVSAVLQRSPAAGLVFAGMAGVGSLFLESRQGLEKWQGRKGVAEMLASTFLLSRVLSLLAGMGEKLFPGYSPGAWLAVLPVLTGLSVTALRVLPAPPELRAGVASRLFFNLLPIPVALPLLEYMRDYGSLPVPLAGSVFLVGVVQVGTFLLSSRRRSLERSMEMEKALSDLTSALSSAGNQAGVLRMVAEELLRGSGAARVTVSHGNLSVSVPVSPSPSGCSVNRDVHGLSAVLEFPVMPLVSPERVDAFLTRTGVMLQWITVSETITRETWESIETLVLSLEKTDEKVAEFSKRVAQTVSGLAEHLGFDSWTVHSLRIASLLHSGSGAVSGSLEREDSESESPGISRITLDALKYQGECWDGSGAGGLRGNAIPMAARILAAGIGWERAFAAGGVTEAEKAMRIGSGLIYDPSLALSLTDVKRRTAPG